MRVCEQLQPEKFWKYFEDISRIPHASGNIEAISDYCVEFAKAHQLAWRQDEKKNVIIQKEGSAGYEDSEPVIIQGHMDMVCEKEENVEIDFERNAVEIYTDGDFLKAKGTTLGADDGVALAYAFAILDDDTLEHPPLEVVLTTDEEIGMLGAEEIDVSMLKGRKLLNIDSDVEGTFLTSCAGGLCVQCNLPVTWTEEGGCIYDLKLTGLLGGHSGSEIHKEHANAIVLMGRVLKALDYEFPFSITSLKGGCKDNAIPREAFCTIMVPKGTNEMMIEDAIEKLNMDLKKEFCISDPDVTLTCEKNGLEIRNVLDPTTKMKILFLLRLAPNGVQNWSIDIPDLVETSSNVGIMELNQDLFFLCFSVRSSVTTRKYDLSERLELLIELLGGEVDINGDYPAWEYQPHSALRECMTDTYRDLFHEEPKIQAIHAGLECGLLSGKIEELDCISFGPDIFDIHTPKERLSISSTEKVWRLLVEFLKRSK